MSHSFVQRAPAIAEEILAKTASLPESLRSFTKNLLTKESSKDEGDRLELPKRMTLGELSKIAHENKVDLPKIQGVKSDDYAKVASELVAIAKREEQKEANEVFESAAAIVAANHEKQAAKGAAAAKMLGGGIPTPTFGERLVGAVLPKSPSGFKRRQFIAQEEAKLHKMTPNPMAEAEASQRKHELSLAKEKGEGRRTALEHAPAIGLAVGTPLAAAALLASKGRGEKKEEVKIYK